MHICLATHVCKPEISPESALLLRVEGNTFVHHRSASNVQTVYASIGVGDRGDLGGLHSPQLDRNVFHSGNFFRKRSILSQNSWSLLGLDSNSFG